MAYEIEKIKHTKTGADLWAVRFKGNIDGLSKTLKSLSPSGYWSRYVNAYLFKSDPSEALKQMFSESGETYIVPAANPNEVTLEQINNYISNSQKWHNKYYELNSPTLAKPIISLQVAKKYYKVWKESYGSKSILAFIDKQGNIYKPASTKAPVKRIAGNIKDANPPYSDGELYANKIITGKQPDQETQNELPNNFNQEKQLESLKLEVTSSLPKGVSVSGVYNKIEDEIAGGSYGVWDNEEITSLAKEIAKELEIPKEVEVKPKSKVDIFVDYIKENKSLINDVIKSRVGDKYSIDFEGMNSLIVLFSQNIVLSELIARLDVSNDLKESDYRSEHFNQIIDIKGIIKELYQKNSNDVKPVLTVSEDILNYSKNHSKNETFLYNNRLGWDKGLQSSEQFNVNHKWITENMIEAPVKKPKFPIEELKQAVIDLYNWNKSSQENFPEAHETPTRLITIKLWLNTNYPNLVEYADYVLDEFTNKLRLEPIIYKENKVADPEIKEKRVYLTKVLSFPNEYAVKVDMGDKEMLPKTVSSYTKTPEGREQAIKFAKDLAIKNNGEYIGFGAGSDRENVIDEIQANNSPYKTMDDIFTDPDFEKIDSTKGMSPEELKMANDFAKFIISSEEKKKIIESIDYNPNNYKTQNELNKAIELMVTNLPADYDYSVELKEFIYRYEGAGGLIKEGADDKGILTEFYTPDLLIRKMWALAYKFGYKGGKVLENSVGVGRFLDYVNPQRDFVTAYEINPVSAKICKIIHPETNVKVVKTFAEHFYGKGMASAVYNANYEKDFDLVIGNPPYGEYKDPKMSAEKSNTRITFEQLEFYFTIRGLDCLKSGGILVYVVPSNIFTANYTKIENEIEKRADLLDAYLLPDKTFEKTKVATCIIVLRKK